MRVTDSDQESNLSASPDYTTLAGPSTTGLDYGNNHANGNGHGHVAASNGHTSFGTNGSLGSSGCAVGNGVGKHGKAAIARVHLPGTTLYDDSYVDREEFIRLVIQSLRDVGYTYVGESFLMVLLRGRALIPDICSESASTLEAESGYTMEVPQVANFRRYILDGLWAKAEAALLRLGVTEGDGLWVSEVISIWYFGSHVLSILGSQISDEPAKVLGVAGGE